MKRFVEGTDRGQSTLLCVACVTVHVKDVALVAVAPVDPKDAPTPYSGNPNFLQVRFRTSSNLNSVYREAQAGGAFVRITLCPFDENHMVGFSSIYFRGQEVLGGEIGAVVPGQPPYEYEGFFRYDSQWHWDDAAHDLVSSPLPASPVDLCFRLVSSGYTQFESNIATIPKEELTRALGELPK